MMKKIRCPHCWVINLEKFVSFPHCAGCGALLTDESRPKPRSAAWLRPVGPFLWATIVGGFVATAVGGLMYFSSHSVPAPQQLVIYSARTFTTYVGGKFAPIFNFDVIDRRTRDSGFKRVSVRFDTAFLKDFPAVSYFPPPKSIMQSGSGTYVLFDSLSREEVVRVEMKARRAGHFKMHVAVQAEGKLPYGFQSNIVVAAKISPSAWKPGGKGTNSHAK